MSILIGMGQLLAGICTYFYLQQNATQACQTALQQSYEISSYKPIVETRQRELEHYSQQMYQDLPLKAPISSVSLFIYQTLKRDYKIPLSKNFNLEYTNFNTGTCNFKWEF